jgi:hypothetical protein
MRMGRMPAAKPKRKSGLIKVRLIENPKLEARNPKFETNSNDRNPKLRILPFWKFENLNFGFVSSFDIRISNLQGS